MFISFNGSVTGDFLTRNSYTATTSLLQPTQTKEFLLRKYPGVTFHYNSESSWIDNQVTIDPGASIDLAGGVIIRGKSHIYASGVITGGDINQSEVHGSVSRGKINHSTIQCSGTVSGGQVNHSTIEGSVSGGQINHSTIQRSGTVSGGQVNHSTIERSFCEGQVNHDRLPGSVSSGVVRNGQNNVSLFSRGPTTISFLHTSNGTGSKAHETAYTPAAVNRHETFDVDPPEYLCDPITYKLINNAVSTLNGDTYEYESIKTWINQDHRCLITRGPLKLVDLRPNRQLQQQIDDWKKRHRKVPDFNGMLNTEDLRQKFF